MPSSLLHSRIADSTGQRIPLTHTRVAAGIAAGALDRYVFSSGVSPPRRRNTTQTAGPGNASRTATARTNANSAAKGPFAPSLITAGVHCRWGPLPPDPRGVRHLRQIVHAGCRHRVEQRRIVAEVLIARHPLE